MYKNMDIKKNEVRYLSAVISKLDTDKSCFVTRSWFNYVSWVVLVLIMAALLHYTKSGHVSAFASIVISTFLGLLIGFVAAIQHIEKQWPMIKSHIKRESVEKRLNDINT